MGNKTNDVRLLSNFKGWSDLTLRDVALAYRKAKSDCFWEKSVLATEAFVEFEQHLDTKLAALLARLQTDGGPAQLLKEDKHRGGWHLLPKKVAFEPRDKRKSPAFSAETEARANEDLQCLPVWFTSDPVRSVKRKTEEEDFAAEFRTMADFSVERHIISALWVCRVGHKFDDCLSRDAYGSRLHRYRSRTEDGLSNSGLNPLAYGCFEPFVFPYMRWRNNAMQRMRKELDAKQDIIAVTLDLQNYYHQLDANLAVSEVLHKALRRADGAGFSLTPFELAFTQDVVNSLVAWQKHVRTEVGRGVEFPVGLPLGDAASKVC